MNKHKFELKSISKACDLSRAIYDPIKPNIFNKVFSSGNISLGFTIDKDNNVIFSFAGTQPIVDIERDFELEEFTHYQLGIIVKGFWEGMENVWIEVEPLLQSANSISINGHSLGASHAIYLAGLCHFNGYKVLSLYLFAPPKSSYNYLKDVLRENVPYLRAFKNGLDPVPHLPLGNWCQYDFIELNEKPKSFFHSPVSYHKIDLYFNGITKLKSLYKVPWHKNFWSKFLTFFYK